jgi:hypothetical protein
VRRLELAIEQREPADSKPRDEPGQRDLGSIGRATDHALAEEGPAQCQTVQPADQSSGGVAALDRMCVAHLVQFCEYLLDSPIDPGVGPVVGTLRA